METIDVRSIVLQKIADHTSVNFSDVSLKPDYRITELGLDSLSLLEILYELEDFFAITVESEKLYKLATVDDLVAVVISTLANVT